MKSVIFVVLTCGLLVVSSSQAYTDNQSHEKCLGCEQIRSRLDNLEEKLSNLIDTVNRMGESTEKKLNTLMTNFMTNAGLSEHFQQLTNKISATMDRKIEDFRTLLTQNAEKLPEDKSSDFISTSTATSVSSTTEETVKLESTTQTERVRSDSVIAGLLERKTKLESQLLQNQKLMENQAKEVKNETLQAVSPASTTTSCKGQKSSGIFEMSNLNNQSVYCEVSTFGGGWIVIQQRLDGSVNFNRSWADYKRGIGTIGPNNEFWLGLETIHQITNSGEYELAVEVKKESGEYGYARYSQFKIAGESDKYRLTLGSYSGTAGNSLNSHRNMQFSTFDNDNDENYSGNCAQMYAGGWWYRRCLSSQLNGPFRLDNRGYGIFWSGWTGAATYSRMMIRLK